VPLFLLVAIVAVLAVMYRRRLQAFKEETAPIEFPPRDGWEFDRNQLKVGKCIGEGEFGQVFKVPDEGVGCLTGQADPWGLGQG
jgi:hypothetical protein